MEDEGQVAPSAPRNSRDDPRRVLLFGEVPGDVDRSLARWGFEGVRSRSASAAADTPDLKAVIIDGQAPEAPSALRLASATEVPIVLYNCGDYVGGEQLAGATYPRYPGPEELRRAVTRLSACTGPRPGLAVPLDQIHAYLLRRFGVVFPPRRAGEIKEAVRQRMRVLRIPTVDGYLKRLESALVSDREPDYLMGSLTVGETFLYRTPAHYDELRERKLDRILQARRAEPVRALSAGCSTGEEAYCLGALLLDRLPPGEVEVIGADVNLEALAFARRGRYPQRSVRNTIHPSIRRHFDQAGNELVVSPMLRSRVEFQYLNLTAWAEGRLPGPQGTFDIIFCRNVLLYFETARATRILRQLADLVRPGGVLFLGPSETVLGGDTGLEVTSGRECFYLERPRPESEFLASIRGRDRRPGSRPPRPDPAASRSFESRPPGRSLESRPPSRSLESRPPGAEARRGPVSAPPPRASTPSPRPSQSPTSTFPRPRRTSSTESVPLSRFASRPPAPSSAPPAPPSSDEPRSTEEVVGTMVARGFRLLDEEDFQAASDTFDRAARLLPDAHGPRIGRLFLNANAGEYRTARRGGEALAAEGATRAELYYLLGLLSDLDGETEKARQEFERCLFLDAECLMARFRLAELHSRRDDWRAASREARNLLEQLRDLNPGALVPLSGGMSREAMETLCLGLMKSEGFGDR